VTAADTKVEVGTTLQFTAKILPSTIADKSVDWHIVTPGVNAGTTISTTGLLTVNINETHRLLTIEAVAKTAKDEDGELLRGSCSVLVSHGGIVYEIVEIEIKTEPTKKKYWLGDSIDHEGLVITIYWDDGSEEDLAANSSFTFSPAVFDKAAPDVVVTVTFYGKSANFEVEVNRRVAADGDWDADLNAQYERTGEKIWSLAEYLEGGGAIGNGRPLVSAGGTLTISNGGINVTGRAQGWNGADIRFFNMNDPALVIDENIYKITVYGVMIDEISGSVGLQFAPPYTNVVTDMVTGNSPTFKLVYELPYIVPNDVLRISVPENGTAPHPNYRVTLIEIEKIGTREVTKYTVTFSLGYDTDETPPAPRSISEEYPIGELPVVTREGYTLDGWYDGETKVTLATPVTKNVTLTAKWEEIPTVGVDVQYVTTRGNNTAAFHFPISKKKAKDGSTLTWGDIVGVSYKILVENAPTFNIRHHSLFIAEGNPPMGNSGYATGWGDNAINRWSQGASADTVLGADYVGKWLTFNLDILNADGTRKDAGAYATWDLPATKAKTSDIVLGFGISHNEGDSPRRDLSYYIMHVALVMKDGTRIGAVVNEDNVHHYSDIYGRPVDSEFRFKAESFLPECPCCGTNPPTDCKGGCSYCYCEGCNCDSDPQPCDCVGCALSGLKAAEVPAGTYCTTFDWSCTVCDKIGREPSAPLVVDLVFKDDGFGGVIDWIAAETGYAGLSAKLSDLKGLTLADLTNRKYDRIEVGVVAYSDAAATTELKTHPATIWTATLFQPWNGSSATGGYGNDASGDFPGYGTPGRIQGISNAANSFLGTAAPNLAALPQGIRVERNGQLSTNPVKAMRLYSLRFIHTGYDNPVVTPPVPQGPATSFQISFNLDGGKIGDATTIANITVDADTTIGSKMPANPTKDGYTFQGWIDQDNAKVDATTKPTKNLQLKATWLSTHITINFDLDGGTYEGATTIDAVKIVRGTAIGAALPDTSKMLKTNFECENWIDEDGEEVSALTVPTDEVLNLKAHWVSAERCACTGCDLHGKKITEVHAQHETSPTDPLCCSCAEFPAVCEEECPVCEEFPPPYVPAEVEDGEDYVANLVGLTLKNTAPTTNQYGNIWLDISMICPADFDILNYKAYTLTAKFYNAANEDITVANGLGQWRFATGTGTAQEGFLHSAVYNLGQSSANIAMPVSFNATPTRLYLQNSSATVHYIEITGITFHWGVRHTVQFDLGGKAGTPPASTLVVDGQAIGSLLPTGIKTEGDTFEGWYTAINGGGTKITAASVISEPQTLYANWYGAVYPEYPYVTSGNINVPVHEFVIPSGIAWADVDSFSFKVLINDQAMLDKWNATGSIRGNVISLNGATAPNAQGIWNLATAWSNWCNRYAENRNFAQVAPDYEKGTWATVTWAVSGWGTTGGTTAALTSIQEDFDGEDGKLYLGMGLAVNQNNGSGDLSYYMSDVKLVLKAETAGVTEIVATTLTESTVGWATRDSSVGSGTNTTRILLPLVLP